METAKELRSIFSDFLVIVGVSLILNNLLGPNISVWVIGVLGIAYGLIRA